MHGWNVRCTKILQMLQAGYTFKADYYHYYNENQKTSIETEEKNVKEWGHSEREEQAKHTTLERTE